MVEEDSKEEIDEEYDPSSEQPQRFY